MQNRPIISATIRAKTSDSRESLHYTLTDMAQRREDIWIIAGTNENQMVVGAMSERDLEGVCRILRALKLNADIGHPRVIYLETIRENAEAEGKYIRQTGGYAKDLPSTTSGLADCFMRFAHDAELTDGEQPGSDEAGIAVNKPNGPKPKHGSAHAEFESE